MRIAKKNTILLPIPSAEKPHLNIVLTDPFGNPPKVIVVNLSTYTGNKYQDDTIIIDSGEHPFISRKSFIPYDRAVKTRIERIETMLNSEGAVFKEDISEELFKKITSGLLNSKRTPSEIKGIIRHQNP